MAGKKDIVEQALKLIMGVGEEAAPVSRIGMNYKDVTKRIPELTEAAQRVKAGEMSGAEYAKLVNFLKPVEPYTSVPKPATLEEIYNAVTANKRDKVGKIGNYEEGHPVSLRLDIPAYKDHGVWTPTIHDLTDNFATIAHEPAAHISGGRFDIPQNKALNVAAGANKSPFASIEGTLRKTPLEDIQRMANEALNSDDWAQVGMDPERHGYFYDRKTMQPVISAEEVIQVGPLVLARKPVYGNAESFKYSKGGSIREGYSGKGRVVGDVVDQALKLIMGVGEEIFPHQRAENLSRFVSGSKLLDDAGNPQRLYHITNKDFDVFKPGGEDPTISGPAIWLSPYAEKQPAMHNVGSGSGFKKGTNVMPVYASIKNPLVLDTPEMQDWARTVFANKSSEFPYLISPEAKKAMQDEGYDGIILSGGSGVDNDEVIAFEGNQIKSAIGNTGAYDPTDPRIDRDTGGRIAKGPGGIIDDVVSMAGKLVAGEGEQAAKTGIRAYHASPHDFDKFEWSPRTFGTGEGAQSYGAGLYFAESPLVSGRGGTYDQQFTRKLLELDKSGGDTRMNRLKIGDQPLTSYGVEYDPEFIEAVKSGNEFGYARNRLDRWHELSGDEAYPYRDYALEKVQAWEKLLNDMHSGKSAYYPTKSRIYEVDINARPTQLLDWDAPIKEQSGEIQRAVGNLPVNRPLSNYSVIGEPVQIDPYPNAPPALKAKLVALDGGVPYTVSVRTPEGGIVKIKGATPEEALSNANEYAGKAVKDLMSRTGGDLVKSLERGDYSIPDRTAKLNATGSLYKEGIPGLRYLDAGSRSGNVADPTRNYVIWNDELIDLKKKYEHGGRIAKGPGGWLDDVVSMAGRVISGEGEDAAKAGIRAYQGSPHNFAAERLVRFPEGRTEYIVGQPDVLPDVPQGAEVLQDFPLGRMRMDKIGTGEGAQAYGHGLYAAENEKVAKGYRDALTSGAGSWTVDGKNLAKLHLSTDPVERLKYEIGIAVRQGMTPEEAIDWVTQQRSGKLSSKRIMPEDVPFLKQDIELLQQMRSTPPAIAKEGGHMYEVNIAADPNTFLDWDKEVANQSPEVGKILEKLAAEDAAKYGEGGGLDYYMGDPESYSGESFYRYLGSQLTPTEASAMLREAGIPGIKYFDAGSRGAAQQTQSHLNYLKDRLNSTEASLEKMRADRYTPKSAIAQYEKSAADDRAQIAKLQNEINNPTRNYVVFDDKLISIIRKYGIAGASAMLGYNLMENLDSKQALAATMADREYKESRPKQAEGGSVKDEDSWLDAAMTVARNAADKATFGTSKYAAAGADYLTDAALDALGYENDADFDRALAEQEYAMKEGEEKNPAAAGAGDIIGYVAPYLAIGPAEGALTTLGYLSDYGGKVGKTGSLFARALGFADGGEVPKQGYLESVGTSINQAANPVRRLIGVRTVDLPEGVDEVDYEELMNLAADVLDKSMLGFGGADPYAKRPKKFPVSPTGKIVDRVLPEEDDIDGALRIAKDVGGGLTPEEVGRRAAQDPATFDAIMQKYAIPDRDIAEYEALKSTVAKQPQDIQQMTHVGAPPMRDVKVDMPLFGGEYNIGSAPYNVAPGMAGVAQTAYDLKTLPMYAFGPTKPLAAGMDVAEGIATGDPTQAALAIAFGPGGKLARAAGIGASSYGMDPAEAQAGKERFFSKLLRTAEELPMEKMTGQQALAMLRKGTSPEELRWTGTEDFLANTPQVTKQNLIDYINKNRIQTEDVVLGGNKPTRLADVKIEDVPSEIRQKYEPQINELIEKKTRSNLAARGLKQSLGGGPTNQVHLSDPRYLELMQDAIDYNGEIIELNEAMKQEYVDSIGGLGMPTKFKQHSTPGGQNYEETLITLPKMPGTKPVEYQVRGAFPQSFKTREEAEDYIGGINNMLKNNPSAELKRDLEEYPPKIYEIYEKPEFWEGHWERPDVIAHVRSQILDATPPGANRPFKAWNGDEFQSKWGQEGRDEGFAKEIDPAVVRKLDENRTELMFKHENARENFIKLYEGIQDEKIKEAYKNAPTEWDLPNALKQAQEARRKPHEQKFRDYKGNFLRQQDEFTPEQMSMLQDAYDQELSARDAYIEADEAALKYNLTSGISRAPYVTSTEGWTDLALKKSLDKAIDSGSDYFTWTPGEVQAQRYNLGNYVSEIHRSGSDLVAYGKNGETVFQKTGITNDELPRYIGKDLAKKLIASEEKNGWKSVTDLDQMVGGQGMIEYYNKIVPKRLEEVIRRATGKKPKIETITVQTADGPRQQLGIRIDEDLRNARFSDFNKGGRVTGGNTYGNDKSIESALALTREY